MSRHHIDFITLHLPRAGDVRRVWYDAFAPLRGHALDIVGMHIEFLGDVCMRQLQTHAVEAENPAPPRLVMTSHDGAGQVVEFRLTRLALIPLSRRLGRVSPLCGDVGSTAVRTDHTIGPAELPDGVETLRVINEILEVQYHVSVA
jgi:hypothetical protein